MSELLELLLPDADEEQLHTARRWTSFMRLLADDARSERAACVGIDRGGAAEAFRAHAESALFGLLADLLRAHVAAHLRPLGRGGLLSAFRAPAGLDEAAGARECWSALAEFREDGLALADVPAPGEPPIAVARRLFASLEAHAEEGRAAEVDVWRAWLEVAGGDGERSTGERAERALTLRLREADPGGRAVLLAGLASLQLERGAVREAAALLAEHAELVLGDDRLLGLRATASLLRGDAAEARALLAARTPAAPRTDRPRPDDDSPLFELARRVPEWRELLAVAPPSTDGGEASEEVPPPVGAVARADLGAALLAIFRTDAGGEPRALHVEVSPGWRRRLEPWLAERDGVGATPGHAEHALLSTGRAQVLHRRPGQGPLRGALGREETSALVLWPLSEGGEVGDGSSLWAHLELEHHLVPSRARLAAAARGWGELARAALARGASAGAEGGWRRPRLEVGSTTEGDPRADSFARLVDAMGMKTAKRRWFGIVRDGGEHAVVASGGGALAGWSDEPGGMRVLRRSALSRGPVRFDEPEPGLAFAAGARSGLCLPLVHLDEPVGYLAVESERRRDFLSVDLAGCARTAAGWGAVLRAACFRGWHAERFGHDVYVAGERPGFERRVLDVALAARAGEPVVLSGPRGAGKEVLARWLSFEGGLGGAAVEVARCGVAGEERLARRVDDWAAGEEPEALVLKDVDAAPIEVQARLHAALAPDRGDAQRPRLFLTLTSSLEGAAERGALFEPLARRLDRLQLFVPALAERRADVPGLLELLGRRFSARHGVAPPSFDDEVVALLWRQPWPGNVRELENLVYKLVLLTPEARIGLEQVDELARRFRLELVKRLPSRHPDRRDLVAALATTRKRSGNANKTRAALYLGWDPDTLAARLREAGIGEEAWRSADSAAAGRVERDVEPHEPRSPLEAPVEAPVETPVEKGSANPRTG